MSDKEPYRISVPEIPSSWEYVNLPDLTGNNGVFSDGDWVESKDQDPDGDIRLIQLADIGDGRFLDRSDRYLTHEKAEELNCTFLQKGDVLVARMPDPLGRACRFPGQNMTCCTVVDVCIVRTERDDLDHRWLMHTINAPQFRAAVSHFKSGTTRERISRKNLARIEFPLPPLDEQRRIVSKIEELFSNLDAGLENLRTANRQLERYRLSVLQAAVEGRLTAGWRRTQNPEPADQLLETILEERRDQWEERYRWERYESKGKEPPSGWRSRYSDPEGVDAEELPGLPEGWTWMSLDQLLVNIRNGYSKAPKEENGVPVLRISAVRSRSLDLQDVRYLAGDASDYKKYLVEPGDLLFIRYNGNPELVGACAAVPDVDRPYVHPDKLIRGEIANHETTVPEYLELALNCGRSKEHFRSCARTTAGQSGISQRDLKSCPVPVPLPNEQRRIVTEVARLDLVAEASEQVAEREDQRAKRLRQSLLREAFSGELVQLS